MKRLFLGALMSITALMAQTPEDAEKALLELLNQPITVASSKAMTIRESPGIVTVFSREDIIASGARDLQSILRLVPGFDIAMDSQGVASVTVRGIWATEGKLLLRVDGQEFNDLRYSSLFFGNNFTPETIQRIEIIRGPGSATYGGFAELAVVNIVTRSGEELKGASASITEGRVGGKTSTQNLMVSYGNSTPGGLRYSIAAVSTDGFRSERNFQGFDGATVNLKGENSYQRDANVNIGLAYQGFSLRAINDRYSTFDYTNSTARMEFNSKNYEVKYDWKVTEDLTITPKANYRYSQPWFYPSQEDVKNKSVVRNTYGVGGVWDITKNFNLAFGVETFKDTDTADGRGQLMTNGTTELTYNNKAVYAQALWVNEIANVTFGGRYEEHSIAGDSFVPRIGITKVIGDFHFKILAAKAFRAPVGENINLGIPGIKPEKTSTVEVETGYQFSPSTFATVNVFTITTNDPMVWSGGGYTNSGKIASKGAEATITWRGAYGSVNLAGSYNENDKSTVPDYSVPQNDKTFLGAPRHKVTVFGTVRLSDSASLAPSVISTGSRYGYDFYNQTAPTYFKPVTTANLFLNYKLPTYKLLASVGVNNLTDAKYDLYSGYAGSSAPIPTLGRELVFRLGYNY